MFLKIIFLIYFSLGISLPVIVTKTTKAINILREQADWLNYGWVHHEEHKRAKVSAYTWVLAAMAYTFSLGTVLYITLNLL